MAILKDLKAENAALLARLALLEAQATAKTPEQVVIGEYKGRPVLQFSGNHRPFNLGLSKCRVIAKQIKAIEKFAASEGKAIA